MLSVSTMPKEGLGAELFPSCCRVISKLLFQRVALPYQTHDSIYIAFYFALFVYWGYFQYRHVHVGGVDSYIKKSISASK
jgi:hypothetical protein